MAAAVALGAALVAVSGPCALALTERIVTDRHTGLAIDGFDPVAFFADGKPEMGRPDFEYRYKDVIWRFRNEGNRAAFARDPEVYMPRFGGYDPLAVARGVAVPGNPLFWCLREERLYLFIDAEARASFLARPGATIAAAEAKWPDVLRELLP
ncbi:MAG TPA: YHS domain-containing (seleno)protein [Xanthobacteraceae bacterium]|nr:YHS domain-containing (seleno)protein [Xanthobacteraceae bacterium]